MRAYLLVLAMLAGCAAPQQPQLLDPIEQACGAKATEMVRARYPNAEFDARGVPKYEGAFGDMGPLSAWATIYDRCTQKRGLYD